ncbi:hypothetical protein [Streptomyces sp. NPDC001312]|uniref:hypothetical protein n=1 Tax=Streptomyces sp. NPDC001312 TaxID=3364561 RepID=UPI0036A0152F
MRDHVVLSDQGAGGLDVGRIEVAAWWHETSIRARAGRSAQAAQLMPIGRPAITTVIVITPM